MYGEAGIYFCSGSNDDCNIALYFNEMNELDLGIYYCSDSTCNTMG